MNQSRWCVTAVFALGALACSDPVPPAGKGAFRVDVRDPSPAVPLKTCPIAGAYSYDVPDAEAGEELTSTYLPPARVVDGENNATVSCTVAGNGASFSGNIRLNNQALEVSGGALGADFKGTAAISVVDGSNGVSFSSAAGACTVEALIGGNGVRQAQPGSMWATFTCGAVESPPSTLCRATGTFVLENCAQ